MTAVRALGQRTKRFFLRLHEDQTGPNTIEWILLVVVALVVMIGIYLIVQWAGEETTGQAEQMQTERQKAKDAMNKLTPNK